MPRKRRDLTGNIYGDLIVLGLAFTRKYKNGIGRYWYCICKCGNINAYCESSIPKKKSCRKCNLTKATLGLFKRVKNTKFTIISLPVMIRGRFHGSSGCGNKGQYFVNIECSCGRSGYIKLSELYNENMYESCAYCLIKNKTYIPIEKLILGKSFGGKGYIFVSAPPFHPYQNCNGRIAQHRLVVELKEGFFMLPNQTIHHMNGIETDNESENLELCDSSHFPGQRIQDKVKWAKELLNKYEPEALVEPLML